MARVHNPEPDPSVLRGALLPASLVLVFCLIYGFNIPFGLAAAASIPFIALFVFAPAWARASLARFDRDALRLLSIGQQDRMGDRLRRALGARLFAAPARMWERRGLVAAENGRPREARLAYSRAMKGYEEAAHVPVSLLLGYAHACYALGLDAEAVKHYRRVLADSGTMPRVERNLAHVLIRKGEGVRDALDLLDQAARSASDEDARGEVTLIRAFGEARLGNRATAKQLLEDAVAVRTEAAEALREEVREHLT